MHFSNFGQKFCTKSGIGELMNDLASLPAGNAPIYALGGGNPAPLPALQAAFLEMLQFYAENQKDLQQNTFNYPSPQGHTGFIAVLVERLNEQYGWSLSEKNIALTNGSQNAFFMLFNLLAGKTHLGFKRIQLPMAPEYIGYEDTGLSENMFISQKPLIEKLDNRQFKYRIDSEALQIQNDAAALCVSRPTNPTGNVITDSELALLDKLSTQHGIPLIIDNAYGAPFPNIIHVPNKLLWHDNIILSMSLSKLGFPGVRTGIIVANQEIVEALTQMNAVMNLSPCALGPSIMQPLFKNDKILQLCSDHITPFYRQRANDALTWFNDAFSDVNAFVHKPEGSIFLWLWFPSLNIDTAELYQRLKKIGVLVVPGHYFFPGVDKSWPHTRQCVRVNISGDAATIQTGLRLIADAVRQAS